jgi:hypothetical protein
MNNNILLNAMLEGRMLLSWNSYILWDYLHKTTIMPLYSQIGLWDLFCIQFEPAPTVLVDTDRQIR